jgi:cytochrome b561
MQATENKREVFDGVTRLMHWLTAGCMLSVFVLAFSIDFAASRASHNEILQLHRLMGLTIWLMTLFRLVWRQNATYPDWPEDLTKAMRVLARITEYSLYVMLLLQPILGVMQTNAHGDRVNLPFVGRLPALIGKNLPLAGQLLAAHKAVGFALLGLIAFHGSAALFHHFVRRDDVLRRMLPVAATWRRKSIQDSVVSQKENATTAISSQSNS